MFSSTHTIDQWLKVYSNFMRIVLIFSFAYTYFFGNFVIAIAYFFPTLMSLVAAFVFYDDIRDKKGILTKIYNPYIYTHLFTLWSSAFIVVSIFFANIKNIFEQDVSGYSMEEGIYFTAYIFFLIIDYQLKRRIQLIINGG